MFPGARGILGPPPMGMNMMGRPSLLHDMGPHRGPGMQPLQRLPEGLNPQMVGGGPNSGPPGGIIGPGVGLMPPQPGELNINACETLETSVHQY